MAVHPSDKKFTSTFTTHHGAPAWILEEVKPSESEAQAFKSKDLDNMVDQLLSSALPGASIQWDKSETQPEQKLCPPQDDKPAKPLKPLALTVIEKDGDITIMPPIKYFTPEGLPVYYYADPVTGHKYWDICDCDDCYEDGFEMNYDLSPKEPLTCGKQQKGKATRSKKKRKNKKARSKAKSGVPAPP